MKISYYLEMRISVLLLLMLSSSSLVAQVPAGAPNSAQNFNAATASSYAFDKISHVPLNPFTGQTKVSIPVFSKKMNNLSFDLSLDYIGGSGIKEGDPGSICGYGWMLNFGGIITRSRRGTADRFEALSDQAGNSAYNGSFKNNLVDMPDGSYLAKIDSHIASYQRNQEDGQLDVFEFNLNGRSGKFYIGHDKTVLQVQKSGLKIIPTFVTQFIAYKNTNIYPIASFKVIDENGVQYFFNQAERSFYSQWGIPNGGPGDYTNNIDVYNSSWMLTRIQSPNGLENVDLTYGETAWKTATSFYDGVIHSYDENGRLWPVIVYNESVNYPTAMVTEVFLQSITFSDQEKVVLNYFTDTMPGGAYGDAPLLNQINCYKGSQFTNGYYLDYMQGGGTLGIDLTYTSKIGTDNLLKDVRAHYYLKGIRGYTPEGKLNTPYIFEYYLNSVINQSFLSKTGGIDHWSYYNGSSTQSLLDATMNNIANRNPNLTYAQMGVLKKVIYPTGGYESFTYELNNYQTPGGPGATGGLRIKADTLNDGLNPSHVLVKEYKYVEENGNSSGFLGGTPVYSNTSKVFRNDGSWLSGSAGYTKVLTTTTPQNPLSYVEGSPVGYRRVEEIEIANGVTNGKIVYEYSDLNYINSLGYAAYWSQPQVFPYRQLDQPEWLIGLPLKTSYFAAGGKLVKQIQNTYNGTVIQNQATNYKSWMVAASDQVYMDPYDQSDKIWLEPSLSVTRSSGWFYDIYKVQHYYPLTGDASLTSSTETNYPSDGTLTATSATTTYTDDPTNGQVRTVTKNNSKGASVITKFYYPYDYDLGSTAATTKMVANNEISRAIVVENWLLNFSGLSLLNSSVMEYGVFGNGTQLVKVDKLFNDLPIPSNLAGAQVTTSLFAGRTYTTDELYDYDSNARLVSRRKDGGPYSSVILDTYNRIIAKAENAAYNQIAYENFETSDNGNWTLSGNRNPGGMIGSYFFSGTLTKTYSAATNVTVTLWSNSGVPQVNGTNGTLVKTINGYSLFKWNLANVATITVNGTNIDEVRCYPDGALMSTYIFDQRYGLIGDCSPDDRFTFYNYDYFARLTQVKNQSGEIVKSSDYKTVPIYYNDEQSRQFAANNCAYNNQIPTTGLYTVPKGRYSSFVSQANANLEAQNEINLIGQSRFSSSFCFSLSDLSITATLLPPTSPFYGNGRTTLTINFTGNASTFMSGMKYLIQYRVVYSVNGQQYTDIQTFTDDNNNPSPAIIDSKITTSRYYNIQVSNNGQVVQQNADAIISASIISLQFPN
jgi:hypothetical protein